MDEPAETHFMTAREVCDLLHIGKTTLASWRDAGTVAAHRLTDNGPWRYAADQPIIVRARDALRRRPA